jgi:hypothetical protein
VARTDSNQTTRRRIGDIFYETRVLMGREYTLARFADEVLEGALDPVMLGYVEKGKRFPNEALVRRLAQVRGQDARELLAVLARDRIAKTIGREIRKLLETPKAVDAIEDAELAARVSRAIAALPDDGSWIEQADWRVEYSAPAGRSKREQPLDAARAERIEALLLEQEVVEVADGRRRQAARVIAGAGRRIRGRQVRHQRVPQRPGGGHPVLKEVGVRAERQLSQPFPHHDPSVPA